MCRFLCWLGFHSWVHDLDYYPEEVCKKYQLWVVKDVFRRGAPMSCAHCKEPR